MSNGKPIVQKVVLAGVVYDEGKILILQRHDNEDVYPGMWELPSGKKEFLEKSEESLLREVREEAGLEVEIVMPVSVFDYQVEKPQEIRDSVQINFLVKPVKGNEVVLSTEHQDFAWITESELLQHEVSEETRRVIQAAFKLMKSAITQ